MKRWTGWWVEALSGAAVLIAAQVAVAQYRPAVPITKCFHEGDPVPGMSGAVFTQFVPPQIDGAGNVLLRAWMTGPGITSANDGAIWYGQPGAMSMIAREGWAAPGMSGVIMTDVVQNAVVAENGTIAFTAYLSGAGITVGVNHRAAFYGTPGHFVLAKRSGEAVPEVGPGITIAGNTATGVALSDNGTLLFSGQLTGDGLPRTPFHMVRWIGVPGAMEIVAWDGMPAPGCWDCEEGDYLYTTQVDSFNDAGVVTMRVELAGPGIFYGNGGGRWMGPPGGLEAVYRTWRYMPVFGPGVAVEYATGVLNALNNPSDKVNIIRLIGAGVTEDNDWVLLVGGAEDPLVVAREGDPAPEAGEGVYVSFVGDAYANDRHEVLYYLEYAGPGIDESNAYAAYFGAYASPRLILRCGDPAPYFVGARLAAPGTIVTSAALNDVGDFVTMAEVAYGSQTPSHVLWLWRGLTNQFIPLLELGATINGRVVALRETGYLADYWAHSGGGDGLRQSLNDRRQAVVHLRFTDGTYGVYRIGPPLLGDMNGDGVVSAIELTEFSEWVTGPGGEAPGACAAMDLDLDTDLDLADYRALQALAGELR